MVKNVVGTSAAAAAVLYSLGFLCLSFDDDDDEDGGQKMRNCQFCAQKQKQPQPQKGIN